MFGKSDPMNSLSRDLSRARDRRDALASHVTTLTAQITELEARLSAENDRRERERVVGEIEGIKERLRDFYLAFAHAIAGMRDASVSARAVVPEAPELSSQLVGVATEVANTVDQLLGDLDRRIETLRASQAAPQLLQSLDGSSELPQNSDRIFRLPEWLPRREPTKKEAVEGQCSTAAACTPTLRPTPPPRNIMSALPPNADTGGSIRLPDRRRWPRLSVPADRLQPDCNGRQAAATIYCRHHY